jgi:hypothetical protein
MTVQAIASGTAQQGTRDLLNTIFDELAAIRKQLGCATGGTGAGPLVGSATWDPGAVADSTAEVTTTITVTGAALGDFVLASFSLDLTGVTMTAYVSATDTVTIVLGPNASGGSKNLASGTLKVMVIPQAAAAQAMAAMVLTKT